MADASVAILTSSLTVEDRIRSEQCGADFYIIKPQSYYDFIAQAGAGVAALLKRSGSGAHARMASGI